MELAPSIGVMQQAKGSGNEQTYVVLGTRKSKLAQIRCDTVRDALAITSPSTVFHVKSVMVRGDSDKNTPFLLMNEVNRETDNGRSTIAKSLWTDEMDTGLLAGSLDILVHSLKDLPTSLPAGTTLAATIFRADPTDAVVMKSGSIYNSLDQLPVGSIVGTSSTRRKALLKRFYPTLKAHECRGNVDTRLAKLDDPHGAFACLLLASAGLQRMGLAHRITARLSPLKIPYAVGQGALALQTRVADPIALGHAGKIDGTITRWRCLAERALLRTLEGGCSSPVGVYSYVFRKEKLRADWTVVKEVVMLRLGGIVVHPHGWSDVRAASVCEVSDNATAEALGIAVAKILLAKGAGEILGRIHEIEGEGFQIHLEQRLELQEKMDQESK